MRLINEQEFLDNFTNNKKYYLSLNEEKRKNYLMLLSNYYYYFISYLNNKLNLNEYDMIFKNGKNNFIEVSEENKDIYQSLSSEFFKYIYIRNNIFIERLSIDEQVILIQIINGEKNQEMIDNFVESTYLKLIDELPGQKSKINYGPIDPKYFGDSCAVILGFRTDDFGDIEIENWSDIHEKREFELDFIKKYLNSKLNSNSSIPVNVIRYDDFSVKKNSNNIGETLKM